MASCTELRAELKRLGADVGDLRGWDGKRLQGYLTLLRGCFAEDAPLRLLEVGMNAGHSAFVVLESFPEANVTSLDICRRAYTWPMAEWLSERHPGRHRLVEGDSRVTLATFSDAYDVVFIDGGHAYETVRCDFAASTSFAPAVVIMNDVCECDALLTESWERGPTRAWFEAVAAGRVGEARHDPSTKLAWGLLRRPPQVEASSRATLCEFGSKTVDGELRGLFKVVSRDSVRSWTLGGSSETDTLDALPDLGGPSRPATLDALPEMMEPE